MVYIYISIVIGIINQLITWGHHIPIGSMVLLYMLTQRGYIDGIHVTIYSSTMDPMGYDTLNYTNMYTDI